MTLLGVLVLILEDEGILDSFERGPPEKGAEPDAMELADPTVLSSHKANGAIGLEPQPVGSMSKRAL